MKTENQTIELNGVKLTVDYYLEGRYYPATQYEPEERPDVIITKITAYDSFIDLQPLLETWEEEIFNALNEYL